MKKLTVLLFSILISFNSYTEETTETDLIETCSKYAKMAEGIMKDRQDGVPASTQIEMPHEIGGSFSELVKLWIIQAYKIPNFSDERNKTNAIEDFANQHFLTCYSIYSKD